MPHYPPDIIMLFSLILAIALLFGGMIKSPKFQKWFKQKKTDRERKRAHAGKLKCQDKDCEAVAVMVTPSGYFCGWHWEPMSKKRLNGGGYVVWNQPLKHSIRRY